MTHRQEVCVSTIELQDYSVDRTDLSDRVYRALRAHILEGRFGHGERLSIKSLAERLQVSVTPVRDALRHLAADGLVQITARRGTCVSYPSRSEIEQVIQIRELIECACAERLPEVSDEELAEFSALVHQSAALLEADHFCNYDGFLEFDVRIHQWLIARLRNQRLVELYDELRTHTQVALILYARGSQRARETVAEHQEILAAVEARDVEAAKQAIRTHLRNAKVELLGRV